MFGSCCNTRRLLVSLWVVLASVCVYSEESQHRFYYLEVGVQAGASYYVGELAPHVFMSTAECYGFQTRFKIDPRWALQLKGQRQRVVNNVKEGNEWGITPDQYQLPMWHIDVAGEYNFFQLGLDEYNIHMKNWTPYISLGIGMTVLNKYASDGRDAYPRLAKGGTTKGYALYIPVGVGLKWKVADRWQLQFAWQHNLYMLNGDGLEGVIAGRKGGHDVWLADQDKLLNNSHNMNGSNVMNNDVTSSLTVGVVFEFGVKKNRCLLCELDI